jgi:hypothetical protein
VWLREGLKLSLEVGDQRGIAVCLESLAVVAVGQGRPELATRLLGAASAIRIAVGVARRRHIQIDYERTLAAARTALGDDRFAAIWAHGQALTPDQAIAELISRGAFRSAAGTANGQIPADAPRT